MRRLIHEYRKRRVTRHDRVSGTHSHYPVLDGPRTAFEASRSGRAIRMVLGDEPRVPRAMLITFRPFQEF
jgi:hypothetical protein